MKRTAINGNVKGFIGPILIKVPSFHVGQEIHIKEFSKCGSKVKERAQWRNTERSYKLHKGIVTGVYTNFCNIIGENGYKESINYKDIQTHEIEVSILN